MDCEFPCFYELWIKHLCISSGPGPPEWGREHLVAVRDRDPLDERERSLQGLPRGSGRGPGLPSGLPHTVSLPFECALLSAPLAKAYGYHNNYFLTIRMEYIGY